MAQPEVKSLLPGFLAVPGANDHHLQWNHPLSSALKNPGPCPGLTPQGRFHPLVVMRKDTLPVRSPINSAQSVSAVSTTARVVHDSDFLTPKDSDTFNAAALAASTNGTLNQCRASVKHSPPVFLKTASKRIGFSRAQPLCIGPGAARSVSVKDADEHPRPARSFQPTWHDFGRIQARTCTLKARLHPRRSISAIFQERPTRSTP